MLNILFPVADVVSSFKMSNTSGQAIVVILLIGSVFAWSIMVTKFAELRSAARNSRVFFEAYRNSRHPLALFKSEIRGPWSPLSSIYRDVCEYLVESAGSSGSGAAHRDDNNRTDPTLKDCRIQAVRNFADQLISERILDLEKQMSILSTAATAAPFLGLLGTVWGVMDAFGGLAMSASATLSAVAPGIAGALLTTVVGLVVALPSLIGYNMLVGRIRRLTLLAERFVQELIGDVERYCLREP